MKPSIIFGGLTTESLIPWHS